MGYWTNEGHLTDFALEHWASGELELSELQALSHHLQACPECRVEAEEWRDLIAALVALPHHEPGPEFDDAVMERVRVGAIVSAPASLAVWWRRARAVAMGVAAGWLAAVAGAALWLGTRVEGAPAALLGGLLETGRELLWAAVVKVAAILHLSGLLDVWREAEQVIPGPGVLSAVACMTAISALAMWALYRAADLKNVRLRAHV